MEPIPNLQVESERGIESPQVIGPTVQASTLLGVVDLSGLRGPGL